MFEHIRKKFPWRIRAERQRRKEEFVKKLQRGCSQPKIRFKDASNIPTGVIILLHDYSDGTMLNAIYTGSGNWHIYGNTSSKNTSVGPVSMTTIEFEDLLTEKRNKATSTKDKLLISDENKLLNIDYSAHKSNAGFSIMPWQSIGNDEDD